MPIPVPLPSIASAKKYAADNRSNVYPETQILLGDGKASFTPTPCTA